MQPGLKLENVSGGKWSDRRIEGNSHNATFENCDLLIVKSLERDNNVCEGL